MRNRKFFATVGLTLALVMGGGSVASAWYWATSGAPLSVVDAGKTSGQGHGAVWAERINYVYTTASLRDLYTNSRSVYESTTAWKNGAGAAEAQTGRYGGTKWKAMDRTTITLFPSYGGYSATLKVCEDVSLRPDNCGSSKSGSF